MPFDVPEHRLALTGALRKALEECGADRWCLTEAWILAEHLVFAYEAFVLTLRRRAEWDECRKRDPDWRWRPPNRTEPQG